MEENENIQVQNDETKPAQNKFLTAITFILIGILAFGAGLFSGIMITNQNNTNSPLGGTPTNLGQYRLLNEVINIAKNNYIRPLSEEDLSKSILLGLDPYSVYFNAKEFQLFNEQTKGEYSGIGVMMQLDDNKRSVSVAEVFRPSPADEAGVQEGWIIHAINGEVITTTDLDLISNKIKGEEGTSVTIDP